ncbi:tetratricopeptide repeat protein [Legionella gresilensis]|uniref:tetratricopeptide repeat protein n=1 Tax=Legionella gresilensis TaxID=91823 RepID=UPI0010419F3D|nr:tetratricopeptide repeat protein [Legionella gresilensis]
MITIALNSSLLFKEKSAYDEAQMISRIANEMLAGNYINYSALLNLFISPIFQENLKNDVALKELISNLGIECTKQADAGCSYVKLLQALLYYTGISYPLDHRKAIDILNKEITLGNPVAMTLRAIMHERSEGGPVNLLAAIQLYDQAILFGDDCAMHNRALIHLQGLGGSINYPEIIRLFDQAILLGNSSALANRAFMHEQGLGGPINYPEAIRLYDEAILLRNCSAMNNRATMHQRGRGGPVNYPEAIRLYECALRHGSFEAKNNISIAIYHYFNDRRQAEALLIYLWDDLISGQSFSKITLSVLSKYCKEDVIAYLQTSLLSTSLAFLKQLKTDRLHPIALILNDGRTDITSQEFKSLMKYAQSLADTRVTFFHEERKKVASSPFNSLPIEIKMHLFSFLQPGIELDRQQEKDSGLPVLTPFDKLRKN